MNERDFFLELLEKYRGLDKDEERSRSKMIKFVNDNSECFDNGFEQGHITGSALVVDGSFEYALLTHHTKLNKWFQFGGHSDSHYNPLEVAWREAEEESGLNSLAYLPGHEGIFDIDIHPIPGRGKMPVHNHYDVRILLTADKSEPYKISHESNDLKWIKLGEIEKYNSQHAFLRLANKAVNLKSKTTRRKK